MYKLDIMFKIAVAMSKLHKNGIGHFDFKGANVFMINDALPVLADFGFSRTFK